MSIAGQMSEGVSVEVWLADPTLAGGLVLAGLPGGLDASFSPDERERYERLRRTQDKELHLASHLLARAALADATRTQRRDWRIEPDPDGRPLAVARSDGVAPAISISHTSGLVACALSRKRAVGIDVEAVGRRVDAMAMARRNSAPAELADVTALDGPARTRRFLEYWTLKEAYLKARGIGLRVSLKEIELEISADKRVALKADASHSSDQRWALRLLEAPDGYVAALAVAMPALGDLEVRQRVATRADLLGDERL